MVMSFGGRVGEGIFMMWWVRWLSLRLLFTFILVMFSF